MIEHVSLLLPAFLVSLLASVAAGIVGSYSVVKRIVFIAGSISHAVLGGLGGAIFLKKALLLDWLEPIHGAAFAALTSAYLIGWVGLNMKQREDTIIGAIWALGMAIGIICISLTPGYTTELFDFLFGNIIWSTNRDVQLLAILNGCIVLIAILFHRKFTAICFDEIESRLQGIAVKRIYFLLLALIALTVVVLIKVVGAILVIAFLSLPAGAAGAFSSRVSQMIFLAIGIGMGASFVGITLSALLNWPSGATIATVSSVIYFFSLLLRKGIGYQK